MISYSYKQLEADLLIDNEKCPTLKLILGCIANMMKWYKAYRNYYSHSLYKKWHKNYKTGAHSIHETQYMLQASNKEGLFKQWQQTYIMVLSCYLNTRQFWGQS